MGKSVGPETLHCPISREKPEESPLLHRPILRFIPCGCFASIATVLTETTIGLCLLDVRTILIDSSIPYPRGIRDTRNRGAIMVTLIAVGVVIVPIVRIVRYVARMRRIVYVLRALEKRGESTILSG